ncbi:MAG TPA: hypothetical protein VLJ59_11085 [Mycobacteriales bacterium]|nr:hypothetical protein [Mycobacteriales bacterium]
MTLSPSDLGTVELGTIDLGIIDTGPVAVTSPPPFTVPDEDAALSDLADAHSPQSPGMTPGTGRISAGLPRGWSPPTVPAGRGWRRVSSLQPARRPRRAPAVPWPGVLRPRGQRQDTQGQDTQRQRLGRLQRQQEPQLFGWEPVRQTQSTKTAAPTGAAPELAELFARFQRRRTNRGSAGRWVVYAILILIGLQLLARIVAR